MKTHRATLEDKAAAARIILFCLPASAHFEIAGRIAPHLSKDSLCLTVAKGLDESGRTASQVL